VQAVELPPCGRCLGEKTVERYVEVEASFTDPGFLHYTGDAECPDCDGEGVWHTDRDAFYERDCERIRARGEVGILVEERD
jgi:hypothetical protein